MKVTMWLDRFYILCAIYIAFVIKCLAAEGVDYKWACDNGKCLKTRNDPKSKDPALSLEACKMFCNEYAMYTGSFGQGLQRFKKTVALSIPEGAVPKTTGKVLLVHLINQDPDNKGDKGC
ncbi:hypothetical protein MSG28_006360 [Choristoneura fumiferana]|uniref:Uncharacterized protein n=3 Tax=Choristoneura fumiferana TaxID=7141 RepID=A0ACC0JEL8_CHOFU|nr:hypothetical protein MSG28_006360 [Choristoneura fumiferana]KAI8422562.1 hypothetical protein MSG28_006360 [Choristoneura fumiferana]KAI8422563.1 hypothetical protein MSG28_006360 [Choristoneura fumiferana]